MYEYEEQKKKKLKKRVHSSCIKFKENVFDANETLYHYRIC